MDRFTLKSIKFLSTIYHELYYRTPQYVAKLVLSIYKACTNKLLALYKRGFLNITDIHCDNEFCEVMNPFLEKQDPLIKMNYAAAQEHFCELNKIIALFKNTFDKHTTYYHLRIYCVFWINILLWNQLRS